MTTIRSLDIRPGEKWTAGRLAWHMADATGRGQRMAPKKRKRRWWPWLLAVYGTPIILALSLVVSIWLMRHGI